MTGETTFRINVNHDRLWSRYEAIAQFGATANGGVNLAALASEDPGHSWAWPAVQLLKQLHAVGRRCFDDSFGMLAEFEVVEALDAVGLTTSY